MRTIIDLPEHDRRALDDLSRHLQISRAEAVRRAVRAYLESQQVDEDVDVFGRWRERGEDGMAYQDRIRGE